MKNIKWRIFVVSTLCAVFATTLCTSTFAYEMHPPYILTFSVSSPTHTCALKVYDYGLQNIAATQFNACTTKWNNVSGTRVSSEKVTSSNSANVRMITPSTTWWENYWGYDSFLYYFVYAQSQLYNSTGNIVSDANNEPNQNENIRSNNIYFTPYETHAFDVKPNSTQVLKVLVHEIGHTLGLGHPPVGVTANSVMHQGFAGNALFTSPQQLDITAIQTKYANK